MEHMAEKNFLIDVYFERELYQKYIIEIKSFQKYKELEDVVKRTNLQILFSYAKEETCFFIQYEVGFKICDKNGEMISVPKESKFSDSLANLLSFFPVVNYNKITRKIRVSDIDKKELDEDCNLFIEYLWEVY